MYNFRSMMHRTGRYAWILWAVAATLVSTAAAQNQYLVTAFGAKGDGKTDDTVAVQRAINSVPQGAVLNFGGPTQKYLISARLILQPGITYLGNHATLLMNGAAPAHTTIAKLAYGAANNVTISGLVFDANGVGGGLHIAVDGGTAIPAANLQITHNVFRNATNSPAGPWDGAIYSPVGLVNSQITQNTISNCGDGMTLVDLNAVTIADNVFQTVHYSDAISVTFSAAPFIYGQNIQILRNTGQHMGRIAIEFWPSGGNNAQTSQVQGILIANNTFTDWDSGFNPDTFGISVMAGVQHIIQNNRLAGPAAGIGIELGAPLSTVTQNSVQGFVQGIALQDSHGSTLTGNLLSQQALDGIEFTNSPGDRSSMVVLNNSIINAQTFGVFVNTPAWGGSSISGNFISRTAGAFPSDSTQAFTGIGTTPPITPVAVSGNSITQSANSGLASFTFIAVRLNGNSGANANSTYSNNVMLSQYSLPQSFGLYVGSPGSMDGTIVTGNNFNGLHSASGGAYSTQVQSSGNLVYNCAQMGPVTLF